MLARAPSPTTRHAARRDGARSCVGCGERVELARAKRELIRLVLVPSGDGGCTAVVDLRGSGAGRGAWVHARRACLEQAAKKGLARAARARVRVDVEDLGAQIRQQAGRRVASLLAAARRAGHAAVGATQVEEAWAKGTVELVLLARDAAHAADLQAVRRALDDGRLLVWGTKARLGEALGRGEVAVVALADAGIAAAVRHAIALAATVPAGEGPMQSPAAQQHSCELGDEDEGLGEHEE